MRDTKNHRARLNAERRTLIRDRKICGYRERPQKGIGQIEMRVKYYEFWKTRGYSTPPLAV